MQRIERLSALEAERKTKPGRYADGGGLYLQISANNAKSWLFRFKRDGIARSMGLGSFQVLSLSDAREKARECKRLLLDGCDPIKARADARHEARLEAQRATTFKECAEAFIAAHEPSWRNAKHKQQWRNTLATYVYPAFGDVPVQAVDVAQVTDVLEPIWREKLETASRLRGRIEAILDWATARKYRAGDNPANWRTLKHLLAKPSKVRVIAHHAALPYDNIHAFVEQLRTRAGVSALALEFLILTATRTGETVGARWSEVDLVQRTWTIPAERMKGKKEHRVPLTPRAVAILEQVKPLAKGDYVFPGTRKAGPLSNMALLVLLRRMKRADVTAHGFRSTFRDWVAECTSASHEVAEMALAHSIGSRVEAAYRRGDLFEKRRALMEAWATYCNSPREASNVVAIARAGAAA